MGRLTDYPLLVFVVTFVALWGAALLGSAFKRRDNHANDEAAREDFGVILAAVLTLLGLIIGFSFSMAISRYDQRKNLEEEEANAIGTEIVRAALLPAADAAKVRSVLSTYLGQRVLFYTTRDSDELREINAKTAKLQNELWSAVTGPAIAQPSAVVALAVSGMNDVLNSQGYTQAAWWNRIPHAAWVLMGLIAICCNLLIGLITCSEAAFPRMHRLWTDMGVTASGDDCFLALRGLRTLALRLQQHTASALRIAQWLREQPEVAEVIFPALPGSRGHELWQRDFTGACGLFGIVLKPVAKARIDAMLDGMRLFKMGFSWGGFESLILPTYPGRTRTATRWETQGPCLRLHVGLEDPDDLLEDLASGLARLRG